ncbi:MAG: NAD-dependent epimerase/dehydratase family protein, partial [Muribaculaceae bacterium]|nr:NAD-dependent epimerase/dehydratase family protein [Muribaculaceae bacterium]
GGVMFIRYCFMSSLSALGPGDEKNYTPLSADTVPDPNTRYGLSKIKAEQYLEHLSGIPYIIFRPTGVYGPHEKDYLMMIQAIDRHFDFSVGLRRQMLTFIYVDDLVEAMFRAFESGVRDKKYIISEDRAYTQKEFRKIVAEELGARFVIPVRLPMPLVWIASFVAEKIGQARLKPSTLNRDKFKIMRQRNWQADISDAVRDFAFSPRFSLRDGIRETVKEYLSEKRKKR